MTTTQKQLVKKEKSRAFGKDVYLLGIDPDGTKYWLESPTWDCGWYWGFGYVETFTNNNNPAASRDINSHQHIDSSFMGNSEYYDNEKQYFRKGEYIHNIYDSPMFAATTFDNKTGWELSELFDSFYKLKESAELFGRGGSNLSNNPCKSILMNKEYTKHINEVMIPAVTKMIINILTP